MASVPLYIVEKPAVGKELANFFARKWGCQATPRDGYIDVGGKANIVSARGHLLELATLDHYLRHVVPPHEVKPDGRTVWNPAHLPHFPSKYEYILPQDGDKLKQLKIIKRLIDGASEIFHSADRDREGQAIVDNILSFYSIRGVKVHRFSFSALDDASLEEALRNIGSNDDPKFRNMGRAAGARAIADMCMGLNLTRLLTTLHSNDGVMSAGRVQTPLLGIVVERYLAIKNFKPRNFYVPIVKLSDGTELEWRSRKSDVREPGFDDDGRIIDPEVAKAIVDAINRGLQGNITEASSKEEKEAPPLPYSLSAIQSEMSKRHGLPVSETTAACQALYEKKMQSYIGTDCRYLPESMHAAAGEILAKLRGAGFRNAVESSNPSLHYKCWNDDKVSAHHAIIPTGERGSFSNEAERLVYNAVSSRYIAQFHPESRSLVTRLAAQFGRDSFSASKSEVISLGWKAVDHGEDEDVVKATAKDELALKMADRSGP